MLNQYDCWESVTDAEVASAKAANPNLYAWQGYVPGWGAPYGGGWAASGVAAVLNHGLGYLPLLVPTSGNAASTPQTAQGWDEAVIFAEHHVAEGGGRLTVVGLNVEAPWAASDPSGWQRAAWGFVAACKRAGVASAVYGSPKFLISLASQPPEIIYAGEWPNGASAPGTVPQSPAVIPGIADSEWSGPGQRIWQYQGGHRVAGLPVSVDCSVTTSAVPYCRLISSPPAPDPAPVNPAPTPVLKPVQVGGLYVWVSTKPFTVTE